MKISMAQPAGRSGVEVSVGFSGTPDQHGILQQYEIETAPYRAACYYAPYQKYDVINPDLNNWPDGSNRYQPLKITDFAGLKEGGMLLLLELAHGGYMALLPLAGASTITWFGSNDGRLTLRLGTLGTAPVSGDLPLLAWAVDNDAYAVFRRVWELAAAHDLTGKGLQLREDKHYPEIFTYLGWCTWEEYHQNINETLLLEDTAIIESSPIPIRYVLVDDGHINHSERRLRSFTPDPAKFPQGWQNLMSRRSEKLRWLGLWLNFNGYWNGICPENDFGDLSEHLTPVNQKAIQPQNDFLSSFAFYDAFIGAANNAGFDFVKVDNQAKNLRLYQGLESPVQCARNNSQALEAATSRHMHGLINCMAHGPVCIFNTRLSAVTRCSEDYKLGDLSRARRHLHNSYANIPWIGQTVWGDHDMFHSSDAIAGHILALSKAMSGGPIYLSDNPRQFVAENIMPLCYSDGLLLRPLAPATPLPDSIIMDPFAESAAYRVVAPLANNVAAIVAYNFTEPETSVVATITEDDYTHANCMMQPALTPWQVPNEGLLVYNWQTQEAIRLGGGYSRTIDGFGDLFVMLYPIQHSWAVIGRADKFLSAAAVEVIYCDDQELIVRMVEGGELTIWSAFGRVSAESCAVTEGEHNLWHCQSAAGRNVVVKVTRKA